MGYHKNIIAKGTYGSASKVREELEEYEDAMEQKCEIMAQVELADLYGALEALAWSHGLDMNDLRIMSKITSNAFKDGTRVPGPVSEFIKAGE